MASLLDLFCGAGGCSVGYFWSGFENIHGIDIKESKDYPFTFSKRDALSALQDREFISQFDLIHASPPCQNYTTMSNRYRGLSLKTDSHPDLIYDVISLLDETGKPWVLENVCGARQDMIYAVKDLQVKKAYMLHLSGGMFNLRVHRPRLFVTSFPLAQPKRKKCKDPIGVYGNCDGRRLCTRANESILRAANSLEEAQKAMDSHWITDWRSLKESIPPSYTEYIGREFFRFSRQ